MKQTFHEAGQTLTLLRKGDAWELSFGAVPILTSTLLGTEREFGQLAGPYCKEEGARVIVGGLGFGSTLAGVLQSVDQTAKIRVIERSSTVIRLVRGQLAHLANGVLEDRRVTLVRGDVADVIAREQGVDAILLDVDNGPEWASYRDNDRLYAPAGLASAYRALRVGGLFAVWSGYPVEPFMDRLREARFVTSSIDLYENGGVMARVYLGERGPDA